MCIKTNFHDKNLKAATSLLGIGDVPLTPHEMANELRVTFYPEHSESELLGNFTDKLKDILTKLGAEIIPYNVAKLSNGSGNIEPGILVIEQGEGEDEDLAMLHLKSLHKNPLVSIQEGPCPVPRDERVSSQARLDGIMNLLTWNLTHIPIFVNEESWVACSATGSVVEFDRPNNFKKDILEYFIPKTSAQVVPPTQFGIEFRDDALDIREENYGDFIDDFQSGAEIWEQSGLMLAHTALDDLSYRDRLHRRLARQYVNQRSGMSYGFVARQLPVSVKPAMKRNEDKKFSEVDWSRSPARIIEDEIYTRVFVGDEEYIVEVPEVWVLSTRSGCEKTDLSPEKDIVRMGLVKGGITFDLPVGVDRQDIQPSYDTLSILAHATSNVIAASILLRQESDPVFPRDVADKGASISHWHGYPDKNCTPFGYFTHGRSNPPVSCSTPQSAVYSLAGKITAINESISINEKYRGDIHIEKYHGTNISGAMSLEQTAHWVKNNCI